MPKFVIERGIPGAGTLSPEELRDISAKSNGVLTGMAPRAQWINSYVTDDKIYCVYLAENAEAVLEHARQGEFPADTVCAVRAVIDPTTADTP